MRIAVNKAHYPVTVLGYGRRIGIWVQGCSIRCKECVSQDTWDKDPDKEIPIVTLVTWCREVAARGLDGITISGGEPFEQCHALTAFLTRIRKWTDSLPQAVDILCYTGLPLEKTMREEYAALHALLDVIVPGPYVHTLEGKPLCGSSNQSVIPLTELGRVRYGNHQQEAPAQQKRMQMTVDNDHIWFVGIPGRGDMGLVEETCRAKGVVFNTVSWLA